ncbi:ASN_collapsed_G0051490.mRNA.1.CDS.1 [Saccharomyces cerevisiae]|nr:ASN_collapsed_G0051490.mRNA.1.CDS.1 [Saccharomyces cerevisiae]
MLPHLLMEQSEDSSTLVEPLILKGSIAEILQITRYLKTDIALKNMATQHKILMILNGNSSIIILRMGTNNKRSKWQQFNSYIGNRRTILEFVSFFREPIMTEQRTQSSQHECTSSLIPLKVIKIIEAG